METYFNKVLIPKKNGKFREVYQLLPELAKAQRRILSFLPKKSLSIKKCASTHIGCKILINLDVNDAFRSIHFNNIGFDLPDDIFLLSFDDNGSLMPGTPASNWIFETYMEGVDTVIKDNIDLTYTRYVDDITLSSNEDMPTEKAIENVLEIAAILKQFNLELNTKKTRIANNAQKQFNVLNINIQNGKFGVRDLKKKCLLLIKHGEYRRAEGLLNYIKQFLKPETVERINYKLLEGMNNTSF